jgi:hypothetical protein
VSVRDVVDFAGLGIGILVASIAVYRLRRPLGLLIELSGGSGISFFFEDLSEIVRGLLIGVLVRLAILMDDGLGTNALAMRTFNAVSVIVQSRPRIWGC